MINKLLEDHPQVKHICFGCDQCHYEESFVVLFPSNMSESRMHELLLHYVLEVYEELLTCVNV